MRVRGTLVAAAGLVLACGGGDREHRNNVDAGDGVDMIAMPDLPPADANGDASSEAGPFGDHGCSDLFPQDRVLTWEVEISQAEWQKLQNEFLNPVEDPNGGGYVHPYHPCVVHLGSETRSDAMIRLKGDSSWLDTITWDKDLAGGPKAQYVVAFDQVNNKALFHGISKIVFDMPRTDPTYLRERLAMHLMRELGLGGVCVASARLNINGSYYGLYAAEEQLGHNVLKRIYPESPDGTLWKSGNQLESSAATANYPRQLQWSETPDIAAMLNIIDLDQAVSEWAAEIVMDNGDGYYGGDHNFYVYDHPQKKKFVWLPNDVDSTFDYLLWTINRQPYWTTHPIYWWEDHDNNQIAPLHFRIVMQDPIWRAKLVEAVAKVLSWWSPAHIQALVDTWAPTITAAAEQDPHRYFTMAEHTQAIADLLNDTVQRPAFLQTWIQCERANSGTDADGDGYPWCRDCNDKNASIHPGASEICGNSLDDNCDGLKDEQPCH